MNIFILGIFHNLSVLSEDPPLLLLAEEALAFPILVGVTMFVMILYDPTVLVNDAF